ncbi:unnamed protein product, partial [Scytosiphon promiscuus]
SGVYAVNEDGQSRPRVAPRLVTAHGPVRRRREQKCEPSWKEQQQQQHQQEEKNHHRNPRHGEHTETVPARGVGNSGAGGVSNSDCPGEVEGDTNKRDFATRPHGQRLAPDHAGDGAPGRSVHHREIVDGMASKSAATPATAPSTAPATASATLPRGGREKEGHTSAGGNRESDGPGLHHAKADVGQASAATAASGAAAAAAYPGDDDAAREAFQPERFEPNGPSGRGGVDDRVFATDGEGRRRDTAPMPERESQDCESWRDMRGFYQNMPPMLLHPKPPPEAFSSLQSGVGGGDGARGRPIGGRGGGVQQHLRPYPQREGMWSQFPQQHPRWTHAVQQRSLASVAAGGGCSNGGSRGDRGGIVPYPIRTPPPPDRRSGQQPLASPSCRQEFSAGGGARAGAGRGWGFDHRVNAGNEQPVGGRAHQNQQPLLHQQRFPYARFPVPQPDVATRYSGSEGAELMPSGGGRGVWAARAPPEDTPQQSQSSVGQPLKSASHMAMQQGVWQQERQHQQQNQQPHGVLQGRRRTYEGPIRQEERQQHRTEAGGGAAPESGRTGLVPDEEGAADARSDGTARNDPGSSAESVDGAGHGGRRSGGGKGDVGGGGKRRAAADDGDAIRQSCDHCTKKKTKCSGGPGQCLRCRRDQVECVYLPKKKTKTPYPRRGDRLAAAIGARNASAAGAATGARAASSVAAYGGHVTFNGKEGTRWCGGAGDGGPASGSSGDGGGGDGDGGYGGGGGFSPRPSSGNATGNSWVGGGLGGTRGSAGG